jgi:hypothetical protein
MLSPEYPYRTTQEIIIASMKPRVSPIYLICRSSGFKDNNNKLKVGTKTRKDWKPEELVEIHRNTKQTYHCPGFPL